MQPLIVMEAPPFLNDQLGLLYNQTIKPRNLYCTDVMLIEKILRRQGWHLVARGEWIAVQHLRPEFYEVFRTRRLGKLIGTDFYITLTGCPVMTQGLILEVGGVPKTIKSTNKLRDATYLGFDTSLVSHHNLEIFVRKVAGFIDDLL